MKKPRLCGACWVVGGNKKADSFESALLIALGRALLPNSVALERLSKQCFVSSQGFFELLGCGFVICRTFWAELVLLCLGNAGNACGVRGWEVFAFVHVVTPC
jgi:hypothetical protein